MINTRHPNRLAAMPKGTQHWNWNPSPSVLTMHRRLHRKFGQAAKRDCVDCGKQAKDWSLKGTTYTDNIDDYAPRCRSCHVKYDRTPETRRKISEGLKKAYREGRR